MSAEAEAAIAAMKRLRLGMHDRELYVDGTDDQVVATVLAIVDNNRNLEERCVELWRRLHS